MGYARLLHVGERCGQFGRRAVCFGRLGVLADTVWFVWLVLRGVPSRGVLISFIELEYSAWVKERRANSDGSLD